MELRFNDPELKFAGVAVKFLPSGKVLVILEGTGVHYTLHPGHDSGVIDIHKTNETSAFQRATRRGMRRWRRLGRTRLSETLKPLAKIR